jgi:hypothetical protein
MAANLFREERLYGVALELLELGVARHGESADLWLALAEVNTAFGRFDEALASVGEATRLGHAARTAQTRVQLERAMAQKPVQ